MATTGAVFYLRPTAAVTVSANRKTGAVVWLSSRTVSGPWSSAGEIPASRDLKNLRAWLPPSQIPIGYLNNDPTKPVFIDTQAWYAFLNYFLNVFIGGAKSPTLADVTTAVTTATQQSADSAAVVAAVSQQVTANAEALDATVQVAKNNSLTGATQIPPVQKFNGMEP